jgi:hypothetical protein
MAPSVPRRVIPRGCRGLRYSYAGPRGSKGAGGIACVSLIADIATAIYNPTAERISKWSLTLEILLKPFKEGEISRTTPMSISRYRLRIRRGDVHEGY